MMKGRSQGHPPVISDTSRRRRKRHGHFAGRDLSLRSGAVSSLGDAMGGWLAARGMDKHRLRLIQLFRHWDEILGEELCSAARPIGHRGSILVVGCADSCAMQELAFASPEILERVNMFMGDEPFNKVELHLLSEAENKELGAIARAPQGIVLSRPPKLGKLTLPADSPVAACYEAYVRMFMEEKEA